MNRLRPTAPRADGALSGAALALLALAVLGLAACSPSRDPTEAGGLRACTALHRDGAPAARSLLLIVNDTMRRDRIGVYGGAARTPHFDRFARENLIFRHAASAAPWTKPAIASLFTALYPSQHRMLRFPGATGAASGETVSDVLPAELDTLAERLSRAGLRTAAFVANPWIAKPSGFDQGFERYEDSFAAWDAPGEDVAGAALDWLAQLGPDERFFAYLHTIDSHFPYGTLRREEIESIRPDDRVLPAEGRLYVSLLRIEGGGRLGLAPLAFVPSVALLERAYDHGIERFDEVLGDFLAAFARHPAAARTAIVITSDHGEALFDRGYGNHGRALYDDEIAIPLAARLPGVSPGSGEVDCPVALVDLLPTLCDVLGSECGDRGAGRSLLAPDSSGERYLVSEGVTRFPSHRAIRNDRYKLLFAPSGPAYPSDIDPMPPPPERPYALYDLREDPDERHDLLGRWRRERGVEEIAATLREALHGAVAPSDAPAPAPAAVDPDLTRRLRALGYTSD